MRLHWILLSPCSENEATGIDRLQAPLTQHIFEQQWLIVQTNRCNFPTRPCLSQVSKIGLPPGDWWSCKVDVLTTAAVLDFVFTNSDKSMWDNNGMQDFHTAVQNAQTGGWAHGHERTRSWNRCTARCTAR